MSKIVSGVYAAVSTPRKQDGDLDEHSLQKSVAFLLEKGIHCFAINGATGEYCVTSNDELKRILSLSTQVIKGSADFVVGIGSANIV